MRRFFLCLIVVFVGVVVAGAGTAMAEGPWWQVTSSAMPTDLPRGGEGTIVVAVANLGDAPVSAEKSPVKVTDVLPAGLTATAISGLAGVEETRGELSCTLVSLQCKFTGTKLTPYEQLEILIKVKVSETAHSGEENTVSVVGGEASGVTVRAPVTVSKEPGEQTPFGIETAQLNLENEDGSPDIQAGSHPFQLTAIVGLNTTVGTFAGEPLREPPVLAGGEGSALVKDLRFNLPAGLVGNPTVTPQCTTLQFVTESPTVPGGDSCPPETAVGVAMVTLSEPNILFYFLPFGVATLRVPVFNLTPNIGEPARFGFYFLNAPVVMDTSLRTGGDYGVTTRVPNITESLALLGARVTFWGVPGDPHHNASRGTNCLYEEPGCVAATQSQPPPFLSLPTSCPETPLRTTVDADSWANPGAFTPIVEPLESESLDGCNRLPFSPEVRVTPDGEAASTPTGLTVDEHVPQKPTLNPTGLAESDVKGLSVVLPEGVTLNPSSANGLEACSLSQIGLQSPEASSCPPASKVATVKIKTPLLPEPVEGAAYLAAQNANPFGSLTAMYIYAEDAKAGVRVKAAGEVRESETGQLTAHFERDPAFAGEPEDFQFLPQLPFEDVEVHFFGGERAPLSTPPLCGNYTTRGSFTPWSVGSETKESVSEFKITAGPKTTTAPNGGPCPNPPGDPALSTLPFNPTLTAQTTSIQAGGFSPFTATMSREDGNQNLKAIQLHMPPGLAGTLSSVKLCEEPQANSGTCGPESLIGHTTVSVGLGNDPYTVTGGQVFITGPYEGAPFGLSIVVPTVAGPFTLKGNTGQNREVVRAKIEVNPQTAALTVTTDSTGPYKIPQYLEGIPLQIKHVYVAIDRSDFTFNPTDCNPMSITGTLSSQEGATSALSVPFHITDCAALAFKPKFTISTSPHPTRRGGESLDVKLTFPNTPQGTEANIAKAKVQLPKRLPSRLSTLQKACTEAVFNANPAGCPAASMVGEATAKTPILPVTLTGPAYFVSHGGAKFPELIVVLQGDNVTVDLHGETFISKQGITTSTFSTVPDVPVSSFELKLPKGPFSALTALGNPCKGTLTVPTEFVAQDGAKINQKTKINVTGCPHHKQSGKSKKGNKRK
jgi:uncharacterized repeat protein (TIGR01451 family)